MEKEILLNQLKGGLIVSCQALESEPLHSAYIMSRMAYAAQEGGAVGIRANSPVDIREIKKIVSLPIIGLYKQVYPDSKVYITPTMKEVDALVEADPAVIALDATKRIRPNGIILDAFYEEIRRKYPTQLLMADVSSYDEGIHAAELGFDFIGTTLSGYTEYTQNQVLPNFALMRQLANTISTPIIGEGGIWNPEELQEAIACGIWAAVIGTAITRPKEITRRFVSSLPNQSFGNNKGI